MYYDAPPYVAMKPCKMFRRKFNAANEVTIRGPKSERFI